MDKQGNTIAGRKRNDEFDFYETPKWATEKAVEAMLTDGVLNKSMNRVQEQERLQIF